MTAQLGIIGGYLGSGKTTLINRLLAGVLPGRTAVVVNDFGSVNIDADLIASASADKIELTNGCICCQMTDDVTEVMTTLAARPDLDHILCEVSGVGDPRQLASWREFPGLAPGPVVVCVDATSIRRLLDNAYVGDTVERQLSAAETVLITKTDLASSTETEYVVQLCQRIAPSARIVVQDPTDVQRSTREVLITTEAHRIEERELTDSHTRVHATRTMTDLPKVDVDNLVQLLEEQKDHLVRAKGLVQDPAGQWHTLQLSANRVVLQRHHDRATAPNASSLVLIAAGPDAEGLLDAAETNLRRHFRQRS